MVQACNNVYTRSSHSSMLLVKSTFMYFSHFSILYIKFHFSYNSYFAIHVIAFYMKDIYITIIKKFYQYYNIYTYKRHIYSY